jgi:hypothetical protein
VLNEERALALGYDLNDPEVSERINGSNEIERRLYFEEAIQLGTVGYDEANQTYTLMDFSGSSDKVLQATTTDDSILTYYFSGRHQIGESFHVDYRLYASEADKEWNERAFQMEVGTDFKIVVDEQWRPYVIDNAGKLEDPSRYRYNEDDGIVENNFFTSQDERSGGEINLLYDWDLGNVDLQSKVGLAMDTRSKLFRRDFNQYSKLDTEAVGALFLTLEDEPFYGGEINNFLKEYGDYTFGVKYDADATRAFID